LLSRRAKQTFALSLVTLVAIAIPVALVAQAAASGGDETATPTPDLDFDPSPTSIDDSHDTERAVATAATATPVAPGLIGFESCTIITGLIPADTDADGSTDICWALDGAGDRPDECPSNDPYMFLDTNGDGIVDTCQRADFNCQDGHPYDSDADGRADACLSVGEWVLSLRPPTTPTPSPTPQTFASRPRASVPQTTATPTPTLTPTAPRPTTNPTPPRPTPTREPYWSVPG